MENDDDYDTNDLDNNNTKITLTECRAQPQPAEQNLILFGILN